MVSTYICNMYMYTYEYIGKRQVLIFIQKTHHKILPTFYNLITRTQLSLKDLLFHAIIALICANTQTHEYREYDRRTIKKLGSNNE